MTRPGDRVRRPARSLRTPAVDPFASDLVALERNRERVLGVADIVIPGHGASFRVRG